MSNEPGELTSIQARSTAEPKDPINPLFRGCASLDEIARRKLQKYRRLCRGMSGKGKGGITYTTSALCDPQKCLLRRG